MKDYFRNETLSDFMKERAPWFRVSKVKTEDGGYDIVLRLDGTYFCDLPEDAVDEWTARIYYALTHTPDINMKRVRSLLKENNNV